MNNDLFEVLRSKISGLISSSKNKKIFVAFSGGLDSHVLLHFLVNSCRVKSKIVAVHVDHNINPKSKTWVAHCQRVCKKLGVKFIAKSISDKKSSLQGASVTKQSSRADSDILLAKGNLEENLRKLRYQIFAEILPKDALLLTAHHADDQAETLLLQLFRGSGPKGLASMPEKIKFAHSWLVRPMLDCLRKDLLQYGKKHKLKWIDDESNLDVRFDRNFIRHQLMPKIRKKWPGIVNVLNRTAGICAEADQLLEVLAIKDLEEIGGEDRKSIDIKLLKKLSYVRQKNVIRFWLSKLNLVLPSKIKLDEVIRAVVNSRYDAMPVVKWSGVEVRRFRNSLYAMPTLEPHDSKKVLYFSKKSLVLPSGLGMLKVKVIAKSIDLKKLKVCFRQGGEKVLLSGRKGTRDLKKLMQEWDIPTWQRDRVPLVYYNEKLIAVVGYWGVDWIGFQ